ncbi:Quinolinate synthetase A protein [Musa troglodytarum]|uniref:Quinolinate synthetase A protein n=1 Tax=Musa troglodytarum TaxID=320322 RepID=A0A9E7H3C7_9LILI|nr:Quinolinate synthetase A protein [Musa troglodytarum]
MADRDVKMAEAGCKCITVLGVDFMSENVRAILDQADFKEEALDRDIDDHLQFVLGTESGMLTSIVAAVRGLLGSRESRCKIKVEIVFPVSSDSVSRTSVNGSRSLNSAIASDTQNLLLFPVWQTVKGAALFMEATRKLPDKLVHHTLHRRIPTTSVNKSIFRWKI